MLPFNTGTIRLRQLVFILVVSSLPLARATAQTAAKDTPPHLAGVLNLDLLTPLNQLLVLKNAHSIFQQNEFGFPLPLCLRYERPLSQRFSLGAELLFNVGDNYRRESGLNIPLRYYFGRQQRANRLLGGYLAPFVTGRFKQERSNDDYYYKEVNRRAIGGGLAVGYQLPLWCKLRVDMSVGVGAAIPQLSSYEVSFVPFFGANSGSQPVANDYGYGGFFDTRIGTGYEF